ncbi:beta-mannanase [Frankia sp. AgPm24]|uniref:glycoside hydrolase family 26 protein n=1 Tax=Frankia sp. AgPm24 TaxID=631128 RepID=UPI00200E5EA2|nr:glycosyl hydrolase [Frankia sp. AgPm24]MCK9922636.1 beta-mannanase [Frankia sp. AgPm24]
MRVWPAGVGVLVLAGAIMGCGPQQPASDHHAAAAVVARAGAAGDGQHSYAPQSPSRTVVDRETATQTGDAPTDRPGAGAPLPGAGQDTPRPSSPDPQPTVRPTAAGAGGGGSARGSGQAPGGLSGISAGSLTEVRAWEEFRGSPVDVVVGFSDRSSWETITYPWLGMGPDKFEGFAGTWVISQPFFPTGGGDIASCAVGAYNDHWREFGNWLVGQGRAASIVRPAWEFNGAWFPWSVSKDRKHWVSCFRQVVTSIRATAPQARIDWTFNAHNTDAFEYYPGDKYVDIIGVDTYDQWPASGTEAAFNAQCHQATGLCAGIAFARQHGKKFSVPEWGLVGTSDTGAGAVGQAGGDNPVYLEMMYKTMHDNADILAYEAYFNDDLPSNVHSSLINPTTHPKGAARYAELW